MTHTADLLANVEPDLIFKALAVEHRLLPESEAGVGDDLWSYTMAVVALCARIADAHSDLDRGGTAGESVRAALLDYRIR